MTLRTTFKQQIRLIGIVLSVILLTACAGRTSPAPVQSVHVPSKHPTHRRVADKRPAGIKGKSHKVSKGDTLYSIAWRAGIDFRSLAKLNKISAPYPIFIDQIIVLRPSPAKTPSKQKTKTTKIKAPATVAAIKTKIRPKILKKNVAKTLAEQKQGEYRQVKQQRKPLKKARNVPIQKPKKKQYSNKIKQWVWPTVGNVIAGFSNQENGNKGIDIGGKSGTSIVSAADGKVVYYGNALRGYGNLIIIKHNDDYLSAYAHNRRILVKEKDFIKAGQKIAEMGNTDSQNVKLHFEVRYRG
ncbi:MAG: lipoprotein NlpD, partial [Alteromonadaceae bacterium]